MDHGIFHSKERLDVVKSLMACRPKPGTSICAFVLEMKGYFDRLESLNMVFDAELSINIILSGLPADYNQFILSYQMNGKETSMELHSLLQTAEQGIKEIIVPSTSASHVLTIGHNAKKRKTSHSNWKGKAAQGKSDRGSKRKAEYEDLKDGMVKKGGHSGMFMIELHNTTTSDSWVLDTGCATHICTVLHSLKESRRLKHGELNLVMGNRKIMTVTRIGKYELMLKYGDGYKFSFDNENGDILVYSNGCFMFKASLCKGIYETVECISNNGNVILNVGSSNEDDVCESCLLGKMTKSPFTGTGEREESFGYLFYKPKDNVVFVARRGVFLEREMISKEDYRSKIDLEEVQESANEEPIVNTDTQQEVVTPVEPDDISLPIHRTSSRVRKPP
ncbi:hypothetical protein Tco_0273561 [Tanacetum coccineum]